MSEPITVLGMAQHDLAWNVVGPSDGEGEEYAFIGGHTSDKDGCPACRVIAEIEQDAFERGFGECCGRALNP